MLNKMLTFSITQLDSYLDMNNWNAQEYIFKQFDVTDEIIYLERGNVETFLETPNHKSYKLDIFRESDFIGVDNYYTKSKRHINARAISDCTGKILSANQLKNLEKNHTDLFNGLTYQLILNLCKHLRNLNNTISQNIHEAHHQLDDGLALSNDRRIIVHKRMLPIIKKVPIFSNLTHDEIIVLVNNARTFRLDENSVLCRQGDVDNSIFIILHGKVEVEITNGNRHIRLATAGPGSILGEISFFDHSSRSATCITKAKTVITELDASFFTHIMNDHNLYKKILKNILGHISNVKVNADRRWIKIQSEKSSSLLNLLNFEKVYSYQSIVMDNTTNDKTILENEKNKAILKKIRKAIIGEDKVIQTPFGSRKMVYADYSASGRSLTFIEDFIRNEIMPVYANPFSRSSPTGLTTQSLREEARHIIRSSVGANDEDVVIFCGTGATGAIYKMINVLNLLIPKSLDQRYEFSKQINPMDKPVVFIGPYEHQANYIPWCESIADVVIIGTDDEGRIDIDLLEKELIWYSARKLKIGSFSAASNVTGIVSDMDKITALLHQYDCLSFWDCAAAAPYITIDMNPPNKHAAKDAVFISTHKFIGGVSAPGILIAKKNLFENKPPSMPAGGSLLFVSDSGYSYSQDIVKREEPGTPDSISCIRAGLAFKLKHDVGESTIEMIERDYFHRAYTKWHKNPNISVLGNPNLKHLSIISFIIKHKCKLLHWNYVAALLNDLFGIQSRGGSNYAELYGFTLFDIEKDKIPLIEEFVLRGYYSLSPGWTRINFNYFISETTFNYLVKAVNLIATDGWRLMPFYDFDIKSGLWFHKDYHTEPLIKLSSINFASDDIEQNILKVTEDESKLGEYLENAKVILKNGSKSIIGTYKPSQLTLPDDYNKLRWFTLPDECYHDLIIESEHNDRKGK